jgi:4-phytase/acid phosphatase
LLEYGNGFPPQQVGWGRASTSDAVIRLSELRKIKYEHQERVPYIAKRGASNILNQILIALRQAPGQNAPVEGGPSLDAKLVLFVGSDTQIAEIGGILNAHWTLRGYLDDETPPGGGLVFELLRDPKTNDKLVRMAFIAQTLDQMRSAAPLSEADPPNYVTVKIPACDGLERDGACPAETFAKIVQSSIDPTAVSPSPYR